MRQLRRTSAELSRVLRARRCAVCTVSVRSTMRLFEWLFGRPLRSEEDCQERIRPAAGVPVLGLDALASAAYGPEAALTVLVPAGALASVYLTSLTIWILLILLALFLSYRQTIAAYP